MWKKMVYGNTIYDKFIISEDGKVKNVSTNHIYKTHMDKSGYVVLTLPLGARGVVKSIRLHKALAETFIPNPMNYSVVHHKDENKSNYSIDNLEWTSSKLNTQYHLDKLKENNEFFNNRKLNDNDIEFIRNNKTIPNSKLAKMFNVSRTTINNVINNKFYKQ